MWNSGCHISEYGREKAAIRILDKSSGMLDIDKLGFRDELLKHLKEISQLPHGMILVCGPTGSGKTSTLYSILKYIHTPEKNLITVEDPVEYRLKGVSQVCREYEGGADIREVPSLDLKTGP